MTIRLNTSGFVLLLLVLRFSASCASNTSVKTCSRLKSVRNVPQDYILKNPAKGLYLRICQSNLTCCSKQMENELYINSSRALEDAIQRQLNSTHMFLTTQASRFDGYMRLLLNTSKERWDNMLLQTYDDLYKPHRHIFEDFFSTLEDYYVNNGSDLDVSFRVFFQKLQVTMFGLIKPLLLNQQDFLNCTARRIDDIQPFGKFQHQMYSEMTTTLIYARTFVMALQAGSNAVTSLMGYLSRHECKKGFFKAQYCDICEGIPDAKMCNATCHNLLESCFQINPILETHWNNYVESLYFLSSQLDGQYDIEVVFEAFSYRISGAMMELHKHFPTVYAKSRTLCPSANRKKRELDRSGSDLYLEGDRQRRNADILSTFTKTTKDVPLPIDTFTSTFRKGLPQLRGIWKNQPQKICGSQTFVASRQNEDCWNGFTLQRNVGSVPKVALKDAGSDVQNKIYDEFKKLKTMIMDVTSSIDKKVTKGFIKSTSDDEDGSGSGSGSGQSSGDDITDTPIVLSKGPTESASTYTDRDVLNDGFDGSGDTSVTTTTSMITDDEDDIGISGDGNNTITNVIPGDNSDDDKKIFLVDPSVGIRTTDGCNCHFISSITLILVAILGFVNM